MSSSVFTTNDVMRVNDAAHLLAPELEGVAHAIERSDGMSAAAELRAISSTKLSRGSSRATDDGGWLDLVARALDLAMPTDQRIALLAIRGRGVARRGDVSAAERDYREACSLANRAGFRREEARLLGELGMSAYTRCDFSSAMAHFRSALAIQVALGDAAEQAITLTELALVHREHGALEDARDAASRAISIHRTTGSSAHEAANLVELARCDLDEGELDRARSRIASSRVLAGDRAELALYARFVGAMIEYAAGNADVAEHEWAGVIHESREIESDGGPLDRLLRLEGGSFAGLGLHAFDRGDHRAASERFAQALSLLQDEGGLRHAALVKGYLAACHRHLGDDEWATVIFAEARAMVAPTDRVRTAIDIIEATLAQTSPLSPAMREHASSWWESRHALQRYDLALGITTTPEPIEPESGFHVAIDGAWLENEGRRVSCTRRLPTQRLLATLARARNESPGEPVAVDALIAAGWPNEDVPRDAGKNRLRVALSWLRKHGLGRALTARGDGYVLDPNAVSVTLGDARAKRPN